MAAKICMAASAVCGRFHESRRMPCQDRAISSRGKTVSVIALSDGAGSVSFADTGASIVVSEISKFLRASFHLLLDLDRDQIAKLIISRLQKSLNRRAGKENISLNELSATLLFVATDGEKFLCGQLGDGRIARFNTDTLRSDSVFDGHKGEHFNETIFVTSSGAISELYLEWGESKDVGGFALMSDGAEDSLFNRSERKFAPALSRMLAWFNSYPERKVQSAITDNIANVLRERTQDDVSLALLRFYSK